MAKSLSDLDGVGPSTVKSLQAVGINSIDDLAKSDLEDLDGAVGETKGKKLIRQAKQSAVIIQSASERQKVYDNRETISTGIEELDNITGGGWESENIVAVYGRASSGKTQLCFQSIASAAMETDDPIVYIETERNRFRPNRVVQMAGGDSSVLNNVHVIEAYDLDTQFNAYSKVKNAFSSASLVVIDSFNSRFRLAGEFEGRGTYSNRSSVIARHIMGIEEMTENLSCPVLLSAQIYDSPSAYGSSDIIYGGNVFLHMVSYLVYVKPSTGEMRSAKVEGHPELPEAEINLNITDEGIIGIVKKN